MGINDFEIGDTVEVISTSHGKLYGKTGEVIGKRNNSLRLSFNDGEYETWMPVEDVS
jgi:ribosomal protein L21E